jgi:hypothetical protein
MTQEFAMHRRPRLPLWLRRRISRPAITRSQRRLQSVVANEANEMNTLAERLLQDVALALKLSTRVRQEILQERMFGAVCVN